MRAFHLQIAGIFLLFGTIGCETVSRDAEPRYLGLTKRQVVARLGTPTSLSVAEGMPEPEMWVYYQREASGGVTRVNIMFRQGRCTGQTPHFDPSRFLSPDRPEDLAQILAEQRSTAGWRVAG